MNFSNPRPGDKGGAGEVKRPGPEFDKGARQTANTNKKTIIKRNKKGKNFSDLVEWDWLILAAPRRPTCQKNFLI